MESPLSVENRKSYSRCQPYAVTKSIVSYIKSSSLKLFAYLAIRLLQFYVYLSWNCLLICEILSRKRDAWIAITDLQVVYEKAGLVVLNKHPNLLINDVRPWVYCLTLQMQLFFNRPTYVNWKLGNMFHFINRLDYATSGLIVIACDRFTANIIGKAFTKRMIGKQYLALVWGHVGVDTVVNREVVNTIRPYVYLVQMPLGEIDHVWPCGRQQKLVAPVTDPRSKNVRKCSTIIVVLEHGQLLGEPVTRLLLLPQTGRRHQLRVHCAAGLGHPIVGDLSYTTWPFFLDAPSLMHDTSLDHRLDRMMLHAYHLNIVIRSQRQGALVHHHTTQQAFIHDALTDKHQVLDLCTGDPEFLKRGLEPWVIMNRLHHLSEWQDVFTL